MKIMKSYWIWNMLVVVSSLNIKPKDNPLKYENPGNDVTLEWIVDVQTGFDTGSVTFTHNASLLARMDVTKGGVSDLVPGEGYAGRLQYSTNSASHHGFSLLNVDYADSGTYDCYYTFNGVNQTESTPDDHSYYLNVTDVKLLGKETERSVVLISVCTSISGLILIVCAVAIPMYIYTKRKLSRTNAELRLMRHGRDRVTSPYTTVQAVEGDVEGCRDTTYMSLEESNMARESIIRVGPCLPERDTTYNEAFEETRRIEVKRSASSLPRTKPKVVKDLPVRSKTLKDRIRRFEKPSKESHPKSDTGADSKSVTQKKKLFDEQDYLTTSTTAPGIDKKPPHNYQHEVKSCTTKSDIHVGDNSGDNDTYLLPLSERKKQFESKDYLEILNSNESIEQSKNVYEN